MTIRSILLLMVLVPAVSSSGQVVTLEAAYSDARAHFPRLSEVALIEQSSALRRTALKAADRPGLAVTGQGVYHSTVASIPFSAPGASIPEVPHLQYRAGVTVEQTIFDGGVTDARLGLERVSAALEIQEVEVAIHGLRTAVEEAFFGALSAARHMEALAFLAEDLEARARQVEAAISEGAARASDLATLRAEYLRVQQQQAAASARHGGAMDVLSVLTGREFGEATVLQIGEVDPRGSNRPEEELIALRARAARQQAEVVLKANRPKVKAFAELAAGRPPGLNLFEDSLEPFMSAGVRLSWRVLDWGQTGRQAEALEVEAERAELRLGAFQQEVAAQVARLDREIAYLQAAIEADVEVMALREQVAGDAAVRLEEGVATVTEYLIERNAAHRARLEAEERRIQLAHLEARRNTIGGAQ